MGVVIGDILPLALGIAIGPLPVIAVILLLTGERGRSKGLAYLVGWLVGLLLLMMSIFLLVHRQDFSRGSSPSLLVSWLTLLAGIGLLLAAYYIWRRRPASDVRPELPGWLKTIHQIRPLVALAVGFFLGLVSLKNLVFATAAASQIGQAHLAVTQALLVILIFIVIASLGVASPVYVSFAKGKQAEAILANWEQWLSLNNTTILCVLCLIIGADLLGDGLGALF